jgi:hypothetical protein
METNMSNDVGKHWITYATWVYLPVAYVDEDLSLLHGGLIIWGPTQVN